MTELPLMAPDMSAQVQQTIDEHPEIDTMDEAERGAIIDITDWRVNGGIDRPWGRKARNNDPHNPDLNTDGMTYLRPDGLFEIYDCISGINGQATWDGYGPFAPGENGYWWPPQPVEDQPLPPPTNDYQGQIDALHDRVETLETNYALLEERLDSLEAKLAEPLHCHGPVDLPIVLESLTRLRAKGDIDVAVQPGQATPPPVATGEPPSVVDAVLLKRLLERLRPEEAP
jgi:hypothetical protein